MKGVKIEIDMYKDIRKSFLEGESIRSIARRLDISRQTVKKYCNGDTSPDVRKVYTREADTITNDVTAFILQCFEEDSAEKLKKQKHTAKRIYDRLVNEKGFNGAEQVVPPHFMFNLLYLR